MPDPAAEVARRPLKVRQKRWAITLAARLAAAGVRPKVISIFSFVFAAIGAMAFLATIHTTHPLIQSLLFILAASMMQLRLVCNLLDGMVAVEGKMGTPDGELFNDLPDRFSDWAIFLAVGYTLGGAAGVPLGWVAAMLAVMTAYVRVLGRACGAGMHFTGPMAKQQRMATMCIACVIAAILTPWHQQSNVLPIATIIVIAGSIWTIVRRLRLIADDLKRAKSPSSHDSSNF